jgi:hypothetical protein
MKIIIGEATSGTSSPATMFRIVVERWQKQMARLSDPYRPERHYMRGPGPKWREKHGLSTHSITDQFAGAVIAVDGAQTAH